MAPQSIKNMRAAARELADALGLDAVEKKEWVEDYVSSMVKLNDQIDARIECGTAELAAICTDIVPEGPSAVIHAIDTHVEVLAQASMHLTNSMSLFHHPALRAVAAGVLRDVLGYYVDLLNESDIRAEKVNPRRRAQA